MTDKIRVTIELDPMIVVLLDATAAHLGKDRSETVADALRCLVVHAQRSDGAPLTLRGRLQAAVDLAFANDHATDLLDGAELAALDRTLSKLPGAMADAKRPERAR